MNTGTAFPLLLRNDHRILRNESCSGYIDIFGIWNTGFYCPQSESKTAVYCCGTDTFKYCCTAKSLSEESSDIPAATTVFIRTPVIIGIVTGAVIIAAFLILTVCFVCPCCFFYKKRTSHIPPGLYRIQCGTSSTTSALINLQSPLTPLNENNNIWSAQPQPPIFTTMVPPLLTNNWRASSGPSPSPLNNRLPFPSTCTNNSFFPSHFIPNFHQINNHNRFQLRHPTAQPNMSSNFRSNFWWSPDSTGTSSYPNYHHQIGNGGSSSTLCNNLGNHNQRLGLRPTLPFPTITSHNGNYGQISDTTTTDNGPIVSFSSNFPGSSTDADVESASNNIRDASALTLNIQRQIGHNFNLPPAATATSTTNGHVHDNLQEYSFTSISTSLPKNCSKIKRIISHQPRPRIASQGEESTSVSTSISHSTNFHNLNQDGLNLPRIIYKDQKTSKNNTIPFRLVNSNSNPNLSLSSSSSRFSTATDTTANEPKSCQFNSLSRIAALLQMKDEDDPRRTEEEAEA